MDGNNTVVIRLLGRFSVEYCGRVLMEPEGVRESQSWRLLKYLCVNYKRATDMDELTKALCLDCGDVNVWNTIRVRLRRTRAILDRVGLGDTQNGLLLYGAGKYWISTVNYRSETNRYQLFPTRVYVWKRLQPYLLQ